MSYNNQDYLLVKWGQLLQRYRLNRNLTQSALAKEAGVSARTIMRLEEGKSIQSKNLIQIMGALGLWQNLEQLIPEIPESPVLLAKRDGKERKHAYPKKNAEIEPEEWSWGDDK